MKKLAIIFAWLLASSAAAFAQGRLPLPEFRGENVQGDQTQTVVPFGSNAPTTTSSIVQGSSLHSGKRNFLVSHTMNCATDAHDPAIDITNGCVAHFADIKMSPGALAGWARNASTVIYPGFVDAGGKAAQGDEINGNNFDKDIGNTLGDPSALSPTSTMLGITSLGFKITGAIGLGTQGVREFNRGFFAQPGTITQCTYCDYNSGATAVVDARGAHQYGFDAANMTGGAAARINSGGLIVSLNHAGLADIGLIGSDASDFVLLGQSSAGIKILTGLTPFSDNTISLGSSTSRFANITGTSIIADSFLVGTGSPVSGVSCSANTVVLATLVVSHGIVTHC